MSTSTSTPTSIDSIDPEEWKELGNKVYAAKQYKDAIAHYSKAILYSENSNHLYYSNRSACYAGLKQYDLAAKDAKECIRLDPSFVKGYYRLALALKELKDYTTASHALRQGIAAGDVNDGNGSNNTEPLHKLLRQVEQLQRAATAMEEDDAAESSRRSSNSNINITMPSGNNNKHATLDDASSRELDDLRTQATLTSRDLSMVHNQLERLARDKRLAEVTKDEVSQLPSTTNCYRSIGKIFVKSTQDRIAQHLDDEISSKQKRLHELTQKKDYLERRFKSQQQNMKDILSPA